MGLTYGKLHEFGILIEVPSTLYKNSFKMCGIAGFFSLASYNEAYYVKLISKMTDALAHRGPDSSGYWVDSQSHVALGHLRLSIIDLKSTGHQPMRSSQDRFIIVYNGEIYNYLELKTELDKVINTNWRGHSDTEILLRGFEYWGIKKTLEKACGMFAFAVFDQKKKKLILARDRIGEKPLYYGWVDNIFFFGSELKVLKKMGLKTPEIDTESLGPYFRYGYIPSPHTIFRNVKKLLPATYAEIDIEQLSLKKQLVCKNYWSAKNCFSSEQNYKLSDQDAQSQLEEVLEEVVHQTLISNVPIGAFLSGGIDSSLIVSLMQKLSVSKVKTFTIGFEETGYNEAPHAFAVANHLGTDHTEFYVTSKDALSIIPTLPKIYDEPFADASQIPAVILSTLTRSKVTVALSGDGGDELFAGYTRYLMTQKLLNIKNMLPACLSSMFTSFILSMPNFAEYDNKILNKLGIPRTWNLARRASEILKMPENKIYESMISQPLSYLNNELFVQNSWETLQSLHAIKNSDPITEMMYVDMMTYLPDDIMVKVDRAAMSVGLETRAPFLDRRIVEFASSLPLHVKISKNILKNILYNHVPKSLLDRPKRGFGIPLSSWLKGPLREWAEDLLSVEMLSKHSYLNIDLVKKKWQDHLLGKKNLSPSLWNILMFQAWYNEYVH
jgi:asparagine synthase (glutamine-hydrolysing)